MKKIIFWGLITILFINPFCLLFCSEEAKISSVNRGELQKNKANNVILAISILCNNNILLNNILVKSARINDFETQVEFYPYNEKTERYEELYAKVKIDKKYKIGQNNYISLCLEQRIYDKYKDRTCDVLASKFVITAALYFISGLERYEEFEIIINKQTNSNEEEYCIRFIDYPGGPGRCSSGIISKSKIRKFQSK